MRAAVVAGEEPHPGGADRPARPFGDHSEVTRPAEAHDVAGEHRIGEELLGAHSLVLVGVRRVEEHREEERLVVGACESKHGRRARLGRDARRDHQLHLRCRRSLAIAWEAPVAHGPRAAEQRGPSSEVSDTVELERPC